MSNINVYIHINISYNYPTADFNSKHNYN